MKNILLVATAFLSVVIIGGCQVQEQPTDIGHPLQEVNFSDPQRQDVDTLQPGEVTQSATTTLSGTTTQGAVEEKLPPAEPQNDNALPREGAVPASPDDLAKAASAYKTGNNALCEQITATELKKQCLDNLSSGASADGKERREESSALISPGTPQ